MNKDVILITSASSDIGLEIKIIILIENIILATFNKNKLNLKKIILQIINLNLICLEMHVVNF